MGVISEAEQSQFNCVENKVSFFSIFDVRARRADPRLAERERELFRDKHFKSKKIWSFFDQRKRSFILTSLGMYV